LLDEEQLNIIIEMIINTSLTTAFFMILLFIEYTLLLAFNDSS
jgi:hypothetical protein